MGFQISPAHKEKEEKNYLNLVHRQIFLDWQRAREYEKETTRNENRIT